MEDRQFHLCMKKMKAGDKAALREIYEAYAGYIFSVVLRVTGSREDAEDVTSDFFIKLWKLADTYEAGKGHRAWLAVVARNMAVDLLRRNRREIPTDDFADMELEDAAKGDVGDQVVSDLSLREALALLGPKEREIVNLKIMGELTFQEIAGILKQPLGTVTWRYRSAMGKLRRYGYE